MRPSGPRALLLVGIGLLAAPWAAGQTAAPADSPAEPVALPAPEPGPEVPVGEAALDCKAAYPLKLKNIILQKNLTRELKAAGLGKPLQDRRLAVVVVDLTPQKKIHLAGINEDEMMYSASLPKIATVLTLAQAAKEGRVQWDGKLERRLSNAINASSNPDASWAVDLVGLDYIEEVLRRPGYCFYGDHFGGLWLGRAFRKGGPTHRDPVDNLSHGGTARQVARFYTLLAKGLLVGPKGNARILGVMRPPRIHHKFVKGLEHRADVRVLARKSGSWRSYHSDSILVEYPDGVRYIAVGLSDHPRGGKMMVDLIQVIDKLMTRGEHRGQ